MRKFSTAIGTAGGCESVRGNCIREGPGNTACNALGHDRPLPAVYGGADAHALPWAVERTRADTHGHHIRRPMLTGISARLAGADPAEVHRWYLAVHADAVEWVEAPNTIGTSQLADGGSVAPRPCVPSGAQIRRMSECGASCACEVASRAGPHACPIILLYRQFPDRHRARFAANPRMAPICRTWDRMEAGHRAAVLAWAGAFLARLDAGRTV